MKTKLNGTKLTITTEVDQRPYDLIMLGRLSGMFGQHVVAVKEEDNTYKDYSLTVDIEDLVELAAES